MELKPSIERLLNPPARKPPLWNYRCQILTVMDGNTLDLILDPGLDYEPLQLVVHLLAVMRTDSYNRGRIEQWIQQQTTYDDSRWPFLVHTERIADQWFGMVFAIQTRECINTILGMN